MAGREPDAGAKAVPPREADGERVPSCIREQVALHDAGRVDLVPRRPRGG